MPPARGTASASSSSISVFMASSRSAHSWLRRAKLASGWNCRPWPGKYCQISSEPGKDILRVLGPNVCVVQ